MKANRWYVLTNDAAMNAGCNVVIESYDTKACCNNNNNNNKK
jgi:hypothetical protein